MIILHCTYPGCEDGWISGHGLCYRLMTQFATFDRAEEKCNQMDAHLMTIENQDESDFISDWLLAVTSKYSSIFLLTSFWKKKIKKILTHCWCYLLHSTYRIFMFALQSR